MCMVVLCLVRNGVKLGKLRTPSDVDGEKFVLSSNNIFTVVTEKLLILRYLTRPIIYR